MPAGAGQESVAISPIPRPAAPAVSLVLHSTFPLAGLVSNFPRNVGGGDLPDSVGPTYLCKLPQVDDTSPLFYLSIISTALQVL